MSTFQVVSVRVADQPGRRGTAGTANSPECATPARRHLKSSKRRIDDRPIWLSEKNRPPISRFQLRHDKGEVADVSTDAISTEQRGQVRFVACRLGQPRTVREMVEML